MCLLGVDKRPASVRQLPARGGPDQERGQHHAQRYLQEPHHQV